MKKVYDIVIVGASAAGVSAAEQARKASASVAIACFTEEPRAAYYRPMLTELMGNPAVMEKPAFTVRPESWFSERNIDLYPGAPVVRLDTAVHELEIGDGRVFSWKRCILATGSVPFTPLPEALALPGVFTCRTLSDAVAIAQAARNASQVVVIGGGLLGLEAAHFLSAPGRRVSIVELMPRILPRQLDEAGSAWLLERIRQAGVEVFLGTQVTQVRTEGGRLQVATSAGDLPADVVLFSIGVRPRTDLAQKAGFAVNRGIVVDAGMRTSHPDVFACGDAAEFAGQVWALWMPAMRMGQVAGHNAAGVGDPRVYEASVPPAALSAFSTRIFSVGRLEGAVLERRTGDDAGMRLYFDESGALAGALLWGDTARGMTLAKALERKAAREEVEKML